MKRRGAGRRKPVGHFRGGGELFGTRQRFTQCREDSVVEGNEKGGKRTGRAQPAQRSCEYHTPNRFKAEEREGEKEAGQKRTSTSP